MKQLKKLKVFGLMAMLISMVIMASSCSDDDTGGRALSYGKVTGVVTDDLSSPLEGVTVLVDGSGITAAPDGPQTTTNSQGVYTSLLYPSPSPRAPKTSRMPSSA